MMIPVRALLALSVTALLTAGPLRSQPAGTSKSVRISGRVVLPDGRPWPSAPVAMAEVVPEGLTGAVRVTADSRGAFKFAAVAGKKYRVYLRVHGELTRTTVETASGRDIAIGDMIVRECPSPSYDRRPKHPTAPTSVPPLTLKQIVIEVRGPPPEPWTEDPQLAVFIESPGCMSGPPSLDNRAYWHTWPMVSFHDSGVGVGVASFVGGKVKSIRVIWHDPKLSPDQIKQAVLRIWRSTLFEISSSVNWAEVFSWRIAAVVERDDGSSSSLWFDSWIHLRVQDQRGKYWYSRLLPAPR
jgi:hypothetical protein